MRDRADGSSLLPDPPLRAERPEPLVDHERRPEDGFRKDRPDVFPERVGLLPVLEQRVEDPEPIDGSATRGRASAALPHRQPPAPACSWSRGYIGSVLRLCRLESVLTGWLGEGLWVRAGP